MFENLVASRLAALLSAYIDGFDPSQIITSVGVWNGRLDLRNLSIRPDAVISADFPIKIISGHIAHLQVVVPWVNFTQAAATFTLDGVDIVIGTDFSTLSDAVNSNRHKQSVLDEHELMARRRRPDLDPGFVQKFLYSLLYNFHLDIRNVRIRLEDRSVSPASPFALELVLDSVVIQSTNSNSEPALTAAGDAFAYKVVNVEGFCLSWAFSNLSPSLTNNTHNIIPTLSFIIMLRLAKMPNQSSNSSPPPPIPRLYIQILIESVSFFLLKDASRHLSLLTAACLAHQRSLRSVESYDGTLARANRPSVPVIGNARAWWRFAIRSWCDVKYSGSWKRIRGFRQRFRDYVALFKDELALGPGDSNRANRLRAHEAQLTLEQILQMRDVAEQQLVKQETDQAQVVANRRRLSRNNWRSFISGFLFSSSEDLGRRESAAMLLDGGQDGVFPDETSYPSSNVAHCLLRFQIRALRLFAFTAEQTDTIEAVLIGLCGDVKLLNSDLHLNMTLLQCKASDVTNQCPLPLAKVMDAGDIDLDVDLNGDNNALLELRLQRSCAKTDVMLALRPVAIVLSHNCLELIDMMLPRFDKSNSSSSSSYWLTMLPSITVDIDLGSLVVVIPDPTQASGVRISIGQASLANALDLDVDGAQSSKFAFDCHILDIAVSSFAVVSDDLAMLQLLDTVPQLSISIEATASDAQVHHVSVMSSVPNIRFHCSDQQRRLLNELLFPSYSDQNANADVDEGVSETPSARILFYRPSVDVQIECLSFVGRFWSSADSLDDAVLSIQSAQLRSFSSNDNLVEYEFECSDAVLENCRIPLMASEFSHWASIRHSVVSSHTCGSDSHNSVFFLKWKCDATVSPPVDYLQLRCCSVHSSLDWRAVLSISSLFDSSASWPSSPHSIDSKKIFHVQIDVPVLAISFLVDQSSRCLFKAEFFDTSYSSHDDTYQLLIDNLAVTDNCAAAPEYANLVGKTDSWRHLLRLDVAFNGACAVWDVAVRISSIRCVVAPRLLVDLARLYLSSAGGQDGDADRGRCCRYAFDVGNPVFLIPYDDSKSDHRFFVVSMALVRLGTVQDQEAPLDYIRNYRFEIVTLRARMAPESLSSVLLIDNCDLVLDLIESRSAGKIINCRLSPIVTTLGYAEIELFRKLTPCLESLGFTSYADQPVDSAALHVSVRLDWVHISLVSSTTDADILLSTQLSDLVCTWLESPLSQHLCLAASQISLRAGASPTNLLSVKPSARSAQALLLEWVCNHPADMGPARTSIRVACLALDPDADSVQKLLSPFSSPTDGDVESSSSAPLTEQSGIFRALPTSLLCEVEALSCRLRNDHGDGSLLLNCDVAISLQLSDLFSSALDHGDCRIAEFSIALERNLEGLDDGGADPFSTTLVLPFSCHLLFHLNGNASYAVGVSLTRFDCCLSVDDALCLWNLLSSRLLSVNFDGVFANASASTSVSLQLIVTADEAVVQVVDDCVTVFNAPMFRVCVRQSTAEIADCVRNNGRVIECTADANFECDSFNQSLDEWEPVIEPWEGRVSIRTGSVTNDVVVNSSNTLDVNFSVAAFTNFNQILSTWKRLHLNRRDGRALIRSDRQRHHFSIKNRTGSLIRVTADQSSLSDFCEIQPDLEGVLQTEQDEWNMKELLVNRRQTRCDAPKVCSVVIANGYDPDSVSFAYWSRIRRIALDGTKVGDVRVHLLKCVDGVITPKATTSKDDLSEPSLAKTYVLSHTSSENSLTILSPILVRNHTPANFCIRVQTSAENCVGQFFVPSGADCDFPLWALSGAFGNATCLMRPYGPLSAEFATLFTLHELQRFPERTLPSRLVHCPGRPGLEGSTGLTFAVRSWTRKISSSAIGIIIEPIVSIINELPCPLYFCLESDNPDNACDAIAPDDITHIHHAPANCRFRLPAGRDWSDLVPIGNAAQIADRPILLDSGVDGSALQPIKLEFVLVECSCHLHIRVDYWFINRTGLTLFYGVMDVSSAQAFKPNQFRLCPGFHQSEVLCHSRFNHSAMSLRSLPVWADNAPWYAFPGPRRKQIETANPALGLLLLATEPTAPHLSWRPSCRDQSPESCSHIFTSNPGSLIGLRLADSEWSMPFPIDSIVPLHVTFQSIRPHSSSGHGPIFRMFDVGISCSTQASTTMVTIAPRYLLHNSTRRDLQYRQAGTMERVTVPPGRECAVHRYDSRKPPHMLFRFRQFGAAWSGSLAIDQVGTVALRLLNRHNQDPSCIIRIDCSLRDATFEINVFEDPVVVQAPYRIENFTFLTLMFAQDGTDNRQESVLPYHSKEFAWDEPMKSRKVVVYAIVDGRSDNPKTQYIGTYSLDRLCSHSALRLSGHDRVLPHSRELRVDVVANGGVRVLRVFDSMLDQSLKITQQDPNYSFSVRLTIAALGVSLIDMVRSGCDQRRREIAYVCVKRVVFDIRHVQDVTGELRLRAGSVQIDNPSPAAMYPVVLVPSTPVANDSGLFLDFAIIKSLQQSNDEFQFFPYCSLTIRPFDLRLEESFLSVAINYLHPSLKMSGQAIVPAAPAPSRTPSPVRPGSRFRFDSMPAVAITRFYCQTLSISSLYIRISFASAPVVNSSAVNPFRLLARAAGASLANIEDVPVRLNAVHASDLFGTGSSLVVRIAHQYVIQMVREAYKLLVSADVLGNPIGLLTNLARGVADVIYLPLRGIFISKSPTAFAVGVWMGFTSLLRNLLFGFCNASAKITSSMAKGITSLSVYNDDRFLKYRSLPQAVLFGAVGLVSEPFKDTSSLSQVYRGFVRGCSGFFLLPLASGFHTLAWVSDALRALSDTRSRPMRSRLPRHFEQGLIVRRYHFFPLEVQQFAAKSIINANEFVVGFVASPPDFILVTSESIFVVQRTEAQHIVNQVLIGDVFSMTLSEDRRSLNLEMIDNATLSVVVDAGNEPNARAVIRLFKYIRRRRRRMRLQ